MCQGSFRGYTYTTPCVFVGITLSGRGRLLAAPSLDVGGCIDLQDGPNACERPSMYVLRELMGTGRSRRPTIKARREQSGDRADASLRASRDSAKPNLGGSVRGGAMRREARSGRRPERRSGASRKAKAPGDPPSFSRRGGGRENKRRLYQTWERGALSGECCQRRSDIKCGFLYICGWDFTQLRWDSATLHNCWQGRRRIIAVRFVTAVVVCPVLCPCTFARRRLVLPPDCRPYPDSRLW